MLQTIEQETKNRMQKSITALEHDLAKIRTGRAHPSLLETVQVEYYGQNVKLNQVASIVVEDARTLAVKPWEKNMVEPIDKAIRQADLGLNPATAGMVIRVPLPPLTEERRKSLAKTVKQEGEQARIALRNIRRDANQELKDYLKSGDISEDQKNRGEEKIQKITDNFINKVEETVNIKIQEIMHI